MVAVFFDGFALPISAALNCIRTVPGVTYAR
jgi:hypothetical protein